MNLEERLAELERLKGWLDRFRPFPAVVVAEMKHCYDVRFTYHSNAIEGNTLTQSETEMVLEKGLTVGGKTLAEHLEVLGHKDAIDFIEELAKRNTPIGEREIKDLHALILRPVDMVTGLSDAGRYRTLDVRSAGTDHVYPPHYRIPELMEAFSIWLTSREAMRLHPVLRAAEAHYQLAAIHPFRDGNGRAARLLMNLLLLRDGYLVAVLRREQRLQYIDALAYAQENGEDTTAFVGLIADACRESLIDYLRILATAEDSRTAAAPFADELAVFLQTAP